jgi:long-chain acyl-CoA synthetase
MSCHVCLWSAGGSVALTPNREAIMSSCDLIHPIEMTTVPLVVNKIYHGVFAKVGAGSVRRQKIVAHAFEVARSRNMLVEAGLPVPFFLGIKFAFVNKVIMSKIRSQILGGKLEMLTAGGGKTSLEVLQFFEDVGLPLCEGYGMTEASPVITISTSPGFSRRRLGSVGQALPGCTIQIRDPTTLEVLPVGTQGEIFAAGDNIAVGYHKQPKATAETFLIDPISGLRFLRTGDLGYMDEDDFLYISGRIKEQYKLQNGKFVSPAPMEDTYNRSMFISQTVVCGADREHNVALIAPELTELKRWADDNNVSFPSSDSKAEFDIFYANPSVIALISSELKRFESEINSYERIRSWTFIDPLTPENDLLTQKMSLKRHNIAKVYAETIEDMYASPHRLGHTLERA